MVLEVLVEALVELLLEDWRSDGEEERGVVSPLSLGVAGERIDSVGDLRDTGEDGRGDSAPLLGRFLAWPRMSVPSARVTTLIPTPLSATDGMKRVVAPVVNLI